MSLFQPPKPIPLPPSAAWVDPWDAGRTEVERSAALGDAMSAVIRAVWDAEANWRFDDLLDMRSKTWH